MDEGTRDGGRPLPARRIPAKAAEGGAPVALLQAVLDYAPIGIWLQDRSGRLLFVNRTYCAAVGIPEEKFLAVPHYAELYDEATARSCMASDRAALAQEGPHTSLERLRFVDGQIHDIEIVKVRVTDADGRPVAIVALSTDVTERLRAEAELKRRQEEIREGRSRLAGIIDSAMDAIITLDEEQRILVFNAAAERIFRCPASEAMGQTVDRFIPQRYRDSHRDHVRAFAETGRTSRTMGALVSALRADGEEFPCEASISRVEVDGRRLLTVIMRDVGERERAESARRALEAKVQQTQKMEALGTLAGGIAHDFNNLLGVVLLNADLALREGALGSGARECLESIALAGERARDLVRRILAFSRRQPQARFVIDLLPALEEAIRFMRATLPAGVELSTSYDPATPSVLADATEIHQIAVNLCTNAWHALEGKEGGRIEVRLEGVTVGGDAAAPAQDLRPGLYARLSVADNGRGMDAATLKRIFDPFFTTKEVGQGTGLGLSVVHGIARELGGAIDVESRPGVGSTFRLLLPAAASGRPGAPEASRSSQPAGKGERVLVVDDEVQLVRAAKLILQRAGFRVTGYTLAAEALAALQADPGCCDAVVADVNMPGMSGLAFAREVARLQPALPVALTSGNLTAELEAEAARAGVRRVLHKPYTTDELREAVAGLVGRVARP